MDRVDAERTLGSTLRRATGNAGKTSAFGAFAFRSAGSKHESNTKNCPRNDGVSHEHYEQREQSESKTARRTCAMFYCSVSCQNSPPSTFVQYGGDLKRVMIRSDSVSLKPANLNLLIFAGRVRPEAH